jgi:Protease inhibitor Inh
MRPIPRDALGPRTFAARIWATAVVLAAAACGLSACNTDRSALGSPEAAAPPARAAAPKAVPLADMAGRWMLGSPGAGQCAMTFSGAPGAVEGTVAPEGGCPGKFFTSRRWLFDQDSLVIRNHTGEPLAKLAVSSPGHFDGQATSGEAVSLAR